MADGLGDLGYEVLVQHLVHGAPDRAKSLAERVFGFDWDDGELYRALDGYAREGGQDYIGNLAFFLMNWDKLQTEQRAVLASALLVSGRVDVVLAAGWLKDDSLDVDEGCPPEAARLVRDAWLCYEDIRFLGRAEDAGEDFREQAARVLEEARTKQQKLPEI